MARLVGLFLAAPLWISTASAQDTGPRAEVWMGPPSYEDGRCFRELFENPDGWRQTRSAVDVVTYADHWLQKQFTDEELRTWFARLRDWRLKLALEVGAIKPWGMTAEKTFSVQRPIWERVQRLGGRIHAVAMDEPLLCCRRHIHKPDDYALRETVDFIARVRERFPDVRIGDIETYPSIPLPDHFQWIDSLQKQLAARGVRGLDFYRLDVNWAEFVVFNRGGWPEVKKLEQYCRRRKLPFSLIYWASGYPGLARRGLADDSTWYVSVMQQGYDYALVQGAPDHYVVQSWLEAPSRSAPETAPFTFTRSVLDFARRFAGRKPSQSPTDSPRSIEANP